MPYQINENYFNSIDTEDKAYWLGFIWGDGYVSNRQRGRYFEYQFKLGLSEKDAEHLLLFNQYLNSNIPIKFNEIKGGYSTSYKEARLLICRKKFAYRLYTMGIKPGRDTFNELIVHVPKHFHLDFMRGLIDSDGGFTQKNIQWNGIRGKGVTRTEYAVHLIANPEVLDFFNNLLIEHGITKTTYKRYKRHKGGDGNLLSIRITGNRITEKIGDLLYHNKENLSLKRKYEKYQQIKSYMDAYRREKCKV